jgi:CRISPR-associated endonuclease/helicase Cas3
MSLSSSVIEQYWNVVEKIVKQRGRQLRRYSFFEKVWNALNEGVRLVIVEAPTACGKTEAVLTPFMYQLQNKSRAWFSLIYALPSRSLVAAMRKRIANSLRIINAKYITVTCNYGEPLALKPYLEGDIAMTTYDTLLYALYGIIRPGYHVLLPLSKIVGSLLVFDEIQLLQDVSWYSMSLIPSHIRTLIRLGAQVVLMSATMPTVLLKDMEKVIRGIDLPFNGHYKVNEVIPSSDKPLRGSLSIETYKGILPQDDRIVEIIKEEILNQGNLPALIVVNTVEKAANIYKRLLELRKKEESFKDIELLLLHSRLRTGIREVVEDNFESERRSTNLSNAIIIATQVVEAGLDLDIRFLITELSPIDSLIQRLGRCARKGNSQAIIFLDPDGGRKVYPEVILEKTGKVVEDNVDSLPRSISELRTAQELIDYVYTNEIVEELRKNNIDYIENIKNLINNFPGTLFSATIHEKLGESPLLRLGYEIQCLYLRGERYNMLLASTPVKLTADEISKNIVKISTRFLCLQGQEQHEDVRSIPSSIIHNIEGEEVAVLLQVETIDENKEGKNELFRLQPKKMEPCSAIHKASSSKSSLLLLNPLYYEVVDGEELGVVRPW